MSPGSSHEPAPPFSARPTPSGAAVVAATAGSLPRTRTPPAWLPLHPPPNVRQTHLPLPARRPARKHGPLLSPAGKNQAPRATAATPTPLAYEDRARAPLPAGARRTRAPAAATAATR